MIALAQFSIGLSLAIYGAYKIDEYDHINSIRVGYYGSNKSWVFPYNIIAGVGFMTALTAPITGMLI